MKKKTQFVTTNTKTEQVKKGCIKNRKNKRNSNFQNLKRKTLRRKEDIKGYKALNTFEMWRIV